MRAAAAEEERRVESDTRQCSYLLFVIPHGMDWIFLSFLYALSSRVSRQGQAKASFTRAILTLSCFIESSCFGAWMLAGRGYVALAELGYHWLSRETEKTADGVVISDKQ